MVSRGELYDRLLKDLCRGDAPSPDHVALTKEALDVAEPRRMTMIYLMRNPTHAEDTVQVLLGHKARGFGEGNWNAFGGKVESDVDPSIVESALRELKEECGLDLPGGADALVHSGVLVFYYPDLPPQKQFLEVHLYVAHVDHISDLDAKVSPSEEMNPIQWFLLRDLPLEKMWKDDSYWLHRFLRGCASRYYGRDDEASLGCDVSYGLAGFFQFRGMTHIEWYNIWDQEASQILSALKVLSTEYRMK